ncbi:hypothetical protein CBS101457_001173 [Exobasidium rhododendri]|nr:hypothetical protein CBS101457_001173 [Exobasidium rhododendri]
MLQKRWGHVCNVYSTLFLERAGAPSRPSTGSIAQARYASLSHQAVKHVDSEPLPSDWQAVIGVEIHAQLKSKKKLFSSAWTENSKASLSDSENTLVAPLDAALPGILPSLQREPFLLALRACLALECQVAETMTFDRKHYFYHDLPSGYQITQKYAPMARNGKVRLLYADGYLPETSQETTVRIEQIQLEQDTAKSNHHSTHTNNSTTSLDLNRAGSALVEIVSGPDMRTAEQAGAYIRKLRETVRRLGVSDGNMDQGSFRCDVNVSVNRKDQPWGVRCEVKNLNSIRFVQKAIGYEIHRQYRLLSSNDKVLQETRGYDEGTGETFTLRSKADAPDYRYMPDPNLAPVHIPKELLTSIRAHLPELIEQQRQRLIKQYNVALRDVNVLVRIGLEEDQERPKTGTDAVAYFEELSQGRDARVALNWIVQVLLRALNSQDKTFADNVLEAKHLGELIDLVESSQVTSFTARALIEDILREKETLQTHSSAPNPIFALLSERGALALDSGDALTIACQEVIRDLPVESDKVRKGNEKVIMRLVGEVMKRAKGRADAQSARGIFLELLRGQKQV